MMKTYDFSNEKWSQEGLLTAYSFRFTEIPAFTQEDGCIATCVNPNHREGFDNISLLTRAQYGSGVDMTLTCDFEDWGCPEIIIVPKIERCDDDALRYGPCFEVVLYKNGINVWRHFRDDGRCHWHKRLGAVFPVTQNEKHVLHVLVQKQSLLIEVDQQKIELRVEDLPEQFHVGLTACEGIVRLYEMTVNQT